MHPMMHLFPALPVGIQRSPQLRTVPACGGSRFGLEEKKGKGNVKELTSTSSLSVEGLDLFL